MKGRQTSIEQYCKKRGLKLIPADPKAVAAYRESMEKLIPEIEREMREMGFWLIGQLSSISGRGVG